MPRSPPQPYSTWEQCVLNSFPDKQLQNGQLAGCVVDHIGETARTLLKLCLPDGKVLFGKRIELSNDERREIQLQRVYMEMHASILVDSWDKVIAPPFYGVFFPHREPGFQCCYLFWDMLEDAVDLRKCLMNHYLLFERPNLLIDLVRCILRCVLQHLDVCHQLGFVHRDIKSDNIMIRNCQQPGNPDEVNMQVFLVDFGLAELCEEPFDEEYDLGVGTVHYMAPEALWPGYMALQGSKKQHETDPHDPNIPGNRLLPSQDLFSVGVLLFEMLHPQGITAFESERGQDADNLYLQRRNRLRPSAPYCKRENVYQDACYLKAVPWAYDLFLGLTDPNPSTRLTAKQALAHPFLRAERACKPYPAWSFQELVDIAQESYPHILLDPTPARPSEH